MTTDVEILAAQITRQAIEISTIWLNYRSRPYWEESDVPTSVGSLSIQLSAIDGDKITIRALIMRSNGPIKPVRVQEGEAEIELEPNGILTIDINVTVG